MVLLITEVGKNDQAVPRAIEKTSVEIPAGKLEKGENVIPKGLPRELEEEIKPHSDLRKLLYVLLFGH